MKKLILAAVAVTCAVSVYAQGTIQFNNRTLAGTSHVWGPATTPSVSLVGQAITGDSPAGTVNYAAAGSALLAGNAFYAQLLGLNGADKAEASLVPQSGTTTFRTGTGAGFLAVTTATLASIPKDAAAATLQLVAWANTPVAGYDLSTWGLAGELKAYDAWQAGKIAAGKSIAQNVLLIGGDVNTAPQMYMPSFNLYFIPEPSSMALAGLGAAALLIFRRRK